MIVNKSMYPIQTSFSAISKLQSQLGTLQTQLGSGKKAATLAEMSNGDRSYSLSLRDQLNRYTGFGNTQDTVNLRLGVMSNVVSRLDQIESDTRTSMNASQYGDDGLNLVSAPKLARSRLDEVITLLNSNINGRYLLAGNRTENQPVPLVDEMLNGANGKDGFATIVNARNLADTGADGMGRLALDATTTPGTVTLSEDGVHQFGFKISTVSHTGDAINTSDPADSTVPAQTTIDLAAVGDGDTVTFNLATRDGQTQAVSLKAVAAPAVPGSGEFAIGATPQETAANFAAALNTSAKGATDSLIGKPPTYSSDVGGNGLGRLNISADPSGKVTLAEDSVDSLGLSIAGVSVTGGLTATGADGNPGVSGKAGSLDVTFTDVPKAGDTVTLNLTLPDGTSATVKLTATTEEPGAGTFKIGATPEETATNFATSLGYAINGNPAPVSADDSSPKQIGIAQTDLKSASSYAAANNFFNGQGQPVLRVAGNSPETATTLVTGTAQDTVQWYIGQDSGNPRQTVSANVDDGTRVDYGVQANEAGLVALVRTLAVSSVTVFDPNDPTSHGRFDAIATRQMSITSEDHNDEDGSIEIIGTELGIAQNTIGKVSDRQTAYSAQLGNMLTTAEDVTPEEVAMQLLATKTRLEASYAATASISQLSLANYLK